MERAVLSGRSYRLYRHGHRYMRRVSAVGRQCGRSVMWRWERYSSQSIEFERLVNKLKVRGCTLCIASALTLLITHSWKVRVYLWSGSFCGLWNGL